MPCPDDEWAPDEWDPRLLFDDPDDEFPLDPPRPIHDVIRDLADYQPRSAA